MLEPETILRSSDSTTYHWIPSTIVFLGVDHLADGACPVPGLLHGTGGDTVQPSILPLSHPLIQKRL